MECPGVAASGVLHSSVQTCQQVIDRQLSIVCDAGAVQKCIVQRGVQADYTRQHVYLTMDKKSILMIWAYDVADIVPQTGLIQLCKML